MDQDEMKARIKAFALRTIRLAESLPTIGAAGVIGKQLLRSGAPVGANYPAACRAKSTADFVAKLGTVEEEADECAYWMELIIQAELVKQDQLSPLMQEAHELSAITVASIKTARSRR